MEVPEIRGDVSIRPGKKVIEDDCRDPILVVRSPRLDSVRREPTRDISLGNRLAGLWIDDSAACHRIDLIRVDDAVARKALCIREILGGLSRHANRANLDD